MQKLRHNETGLFSTLFRFKIDFWPIFMVFRKFFFAENEEFPIRNIYKALKIWNDNYIKSWKFPPNWTYIYFMLETDLLIEYRCINYLVPISRICVYKHRYSISKTLFQITWWIKKFEKINRTINNAYLFHWEMKIHFDHVVVWSAVIEIFFGRVFYSAGFGNS